MPHLLALASDSSPWGVIITGASAVAAGIVFVGTVLLKLAWTVRGATDELKGAVKLVSDIAPRVAVLERDKIERDAVEKERARVEDQRASGTRKRSGTSPGENTRKLAAVSIHDGDGE